MSSDWLTVAQAAVRLGRNVELVRRWCRDGVLPAERFGRDWKISPSDLAEVAGRRQLGRTKTIVVVGGRAVTVWYPPALDAETIAAVMRGDPAGDEDWLSATLHDMTGEAWDVRVGPGPSATGGPIPPGEVVISRKP